MTTDTTPLERERLREDRLGVLVALAAQPHPAQPDEHPSAEDLAAFSEGRLDDSHREHILAHLNACFDCYDQWLAVGDLLDDQATEMPEPSVDPPRLSWWQRLQSWASRFAPPHLDTHALWWPGVGVAVAACLMVALLAPWRTDSGLPTLIERAYDTAQANLMPLRETAARQLLPWEGPTAGFSFSSGASEPARAFAAGQWEGRSLLIGEHPPAALPAFLRPPTARSASASAWHDTEWADYAWLGRWVFLLQAVCRTDQADPAAFWDQQRAIGTSLRDQLAQRPDSDPLARPANKLTQALLDVMSNTALLANRARLCQQIEQQSKLALVLAPPKP